MLYLFQNIIKNNKKMKYTELAKKINIPIFSLNDLRLEKLTIFPYQLSEWSKKGYIIKLKNGLYAFSNQSDEVLIEHISFILYQPSYISLEWALANYGLIPETVYSPTAITTRATRTFNNKFGHFIYRHVKKDMFFGYQKIKRRQQIYLIAEPEKALIDYLYLNSAKIKNEHDVEELRLNKFTLKELDKNKIKRICQRINSKSLDKTINLCLR